MDEHVLYFGSLSKCISTGETKLESVLVRGSTKLQGVSGRDQVLDVKAR